MNFALSYTQSMCISCRGFHGGLSGRVHEVHCLPKRRLPLLPLLRWSKHQAVADVLGPMLCWKKDLAPNPCCGLNLKRELQTCFSKVFQASEVWKESGNWYWHWRNDQGLKVSLCLILLVRVRTVQCLAIATGEADLCIWTCPQPAMWCVPMMLACWTVFLLISTCTYNHRPLDLAIFLLPGKLMASVWMYFLVVEGAAAAPWSGTYRTYATQELQQCLCFHLVMPVMGSCWGKPGWLYCCLLGWSRWSFCGCGEPTGQYAVWL